MVVCLCLRFDSSDPMENRIRFIISIYNVFCNSMLLQTFSHVFVSLFISSLSLCCSLCFSPFPVSWLVSWTQFLLLIGYWSQALKTLSLCFSFVSWIGLIIEMGLGQELLLQLEILAPCSSLNNHSKIINPNNHGKARKQIKIFES